MPRQELSVLGDEDDVLVRGREQDAAAVLAQRDEEGERLRRVGADSVRLVNVTRRRGARRSLMIDALDRYTDRAERANDGERPRVLQA
jgi:hypothetical protein